MTGALSARFTRPGEPVSLQADPLPGMPTAGQVLVRMLRAPINPADLLVLDGRYPVPLPAGSVLGAEGVGVVVAAGPDCSRLAPNDHVLPLSRGNWCGLRVLSEAECVRIDAAVPLVVAAGLRVNPATAWRLLQPGAQAEGAWLIQNAATSSLAAWVRHFATERGLQVINLARRIPPGAAGHWVAAGEGAAAAIAALLQGEPLRLGLDCVAGGATGFMAQCLSDDARLVVFGHLSGEPCSVPSQLMTGKGLTMQGFSLRRAEARDTVGQVQALYDQIGRLVTSAPHDRPVEVMPLVAIDEAVALARQGRRVQIDLNGAA